MIPMTECKSSALAAHGYDPATRTLAVRFHSGTVTHYQDVPPEKAAALAGAESVGKFYSAEIRGKFEVAPAADDKAE